MFAINIKDLSFGYETNVQLFSNLNLDFKQNKIHAILGPNGSGKTTLISLISGHLKCKSGIIDLGQNDNKVGVVFGGDTGFYNLASARDNLKFFASLYKIKNVNNEVENCLKMVNLYNSKDKLYMDFSKGMKQRLHIARGMLGSPDIILLDEPTNGLDIENASKLRSDIKDISKQNNKTIILTSHIGKDIIDLADEIIFIYYGKILFQGSLESFICYCITQTGIEDNDLDNCYLNLVKSLK